MASKVAYTLSLFFLFFLFLTGHVMAPFFLGMFDVSSAVSAEYVPDNVSKMSGKI